MKAPSHSTVRSLNPPRRRHGVGSGPSGSHQRDRQDGVPPAGQTSVDDDVYWYSRTQQEHAAPLEGAREADAVVVGGGMAGLAAAQWLREKAEKDVIVLEARFCGAGATGKSSGFVTPDSELELTSLVRRFGDADARLLWDVATRGCQDIHANVERFGIDCDFLAADSLFVANGRTAFATVRREHEAHARLGFPSTLYGRASLPDVLGSNGFDGAVRAGGTFGIDAYAYVQGLKRALAGLGVRIFEDSPAIQIDQHVVRTPRGTVRAPIVIVCLDRFAPTLGVATRDTYHAQTFIALTDPLRQDQLQRLFPSGPMLVWDTDLTYQYLRLTPAGRLLVGGSTLLETFRRNESPPAGSGERLEAYVREKFPALGPVVFTHLWPGLIGVTKDLLPIAGLRPLAGHYEAMCSAGLPWSVLAGQVAARCTVEGATELDRFFAPDRTFTALDWFQPILGKPLTFALSILWAKNWQHGQGHKGSRG